jgi:hypothetical protein
VSRDLAIFIGCTEGLHKKEQGRASKGHTTRWFDMTALFTFDIWFVTDWEIEQCAAMYAEKERPFIGVRDRVSPKGGTAHAPILWASVDIALCEQKGRRADKRQSPGRSPDALSLFSLDFIFLGLGCE